MVRRFVDLDGARVLDVGCGIGTYVRRFRQYTDDVHGIEVEPERVAEASAELPNIVCAVGEALPYPDDHFDLVFSNEVIEHVQDDRRDRAGDGARDPARRPRSWSSRPTGSTRSRPTARTSGGRYVFGNVPLVNWFPGPHPRPVRAARAGLHAARHPATLRRRAGAAGPPPGDLPGLRQHDLRATAASGPCPAQALYAAEQTPLHAFGLSHFLVLRKVPAAQG